jgi:hypothetical protein
MAQDPVSAVASWLTPTIPEVPEAADPPLGPGRELTEANLVDPLPALWAERDRLWEEVGDSGDPADTDKMLRADLIEEQIIGTVASSASGIVAQLKLAKELTEIIMLDGRDDREERLHATIILGIKQLTGCASLTSVAPTPTPADDIDPVLALIAEEKRLEALWVAATTRGDEIFSTLPEDIQKGQARVSSVCQ